MDRSNPRRSPATVRRLAPILVLAIAAVLASGCSKFQSKSRANLTPFAENTIAIAGDIDYGLGASKPIYLLPYAHLPPVEVVQIRWDRVRQMMRGIVAYSVEVVALSESQKSGPERAQAMADFITELMAVLGKSPDAAYVYTPKRVADTIEEIRQQQDLLSALRSAQPLVDNLSNVAEVFFEDLKRVSDIALAAVDNELNEEYAEIWDFNGMTREVEIASLKSLILLRNYRLGSEAALDSLFATESSLAGIFQKTKNPTVKELLAIENRILEKMDHLDKIRAHLRPSIEIFWKQKLELEELQEANDSSIRKARVGIIVWARAHRRMAAGITDPAQIDLMNLTKKAVDTVL